MKYPSGHKEKIRERIVKAAARRFRKEGIEAVGIAALMQALGLTHGGFYAHFKSKDALAAEASSHAFDETMAQLRDIISAAPPGERLRRLAASYVSAYHRDHPESGCLAAALGDDIARQSPQLRRAVTQKLDALIALIEEAASADGLAVSGHAFLAQMMGAVTLSRIPLDQERRDRFIDDTLAALAKSLPRSVTAA
ncbi:MAG: TetR/AcrR family transcriptional regulator [Alphaproteobacteria bacterium]|nr:TetR/AcrR family transcriptional regulator [Alphaproteobacteria bacterium]